MGDKVLPILTTPERPTSPSAKSDASGLSGQGSLTSSYVSGAPSLGSASILVRRELGMVPEEDEGPGAEEDNALEKPRQRVLSSNRAWLLAVATAYTLTFYLDLIILNDAYNYGPSEPEWWRFVRHLWLLTLLAFDQD